jgi:hypothetical protein
MFHISQLKKCLRVPEEQLPLEELNLQDDLTYTEHPVKILDTTERIIRSTRIWICRVLVESPCRGCGYFGTRGRVTSKISPALC